MDISIRFHPIDGLYSDILSKIVELKKVYEVNSCLQKRREDEFWEMRVDLAKTKAQLMCTKNELNETRAKLEREQSVKSHLKNLFRQSQKELKFARQMIEEKNSQISEMEEFILDLEWMKIEESATDDRVDDVKNQVHQKSSNETLFAERSLSPIPEENPSEIPDYYDQW